MSVEELRKQLDALRRSHDLLLKSLALPSGSLGPSLDVGNLQERTERDDPDDHANADFADSSTQSDHSDDEEEDESFYVQGELPSQSFDHEHLREHLKKYDWKEQGRKILATIVTDRGRLKDPHLFPMQR